jgi:hypothetical protein
MFNDFFCDQSSINDDYLIPPDLDGPSYEKHREWLLESPSRLVTRFHQFLLPVVSV